MRTPLNGIIGLSELLRKSSLPNKETEFIDNIYHAGRSLLKIINNILEFAKIETDKIELENAEFSLAIVLQQILLSLSISAQKKSIKLDYVVDKDVPYKVYGDASRLSQVVYNLIGNAIKFTAVGTVTLKLKVHSFDNENGITLLFSIEDTGIGMSPEDQRKLFLPFNAIQTQGTLGEVGSGLGLAISAQIVKALGGEIHVKSQVGKGTVFSFTAKFSSFSKEKVENPLEQNLHYIDEHKEINKIFNYQITPNILVVDDNPTNLLMAQAMLERLGAYTITANNGKEAVYECNTHNIDLIHMDCQMPIMDGFEATRELRKQNIKIPILAMTANTAYEDQDKCFGAGMNGFIPKPISVAQLSSELLRFLSPDNLVISNDLIDKTKLVEHVNRI